MTPFRPKLSLREKFAAFTSPADREASFSERRIAAQDVMHAFTQAFLKTPTFQRAVDSLALGFGKTAWRGHADMKFVHQDLSGHRFSSLAWYRDSCRGYSENLVRVTRFCRQVSRDAEVVGADGVRIGAGSPDGT